MLAVLKEMASLVTSMSVTVLLTLLSVSVYGAPTSEIVIDLGYDLSEDTAYWPGVTKFQIINETREKNENGIPWFAVNTFESAEHVGTHVDAPFHFNETGWKLGDIPLERFFSSGVLIDVSQEVKDDFNFELKSNHINDWEQKHGQIPNNCIVLVRFGWSKLYYSNLMEYFGYGKTNKSELNFPGISKDAAELFVKRGIYGVGVDTPSLDPGKNVKFEAHQIILGASLFGIENLNLTSTEIPDTGFKLHVLPMKITEGTGAPTRIVALAKPKKKSFFSFITKYIPWLKNQIK